MELVGLVVAIVFGVAGTGFGVQQWLASRSISGKLDAVLTGIAQKNQVRFQVPAAVALQPQDPYELIAKDIGEDLSFENTKQMIETSLAALQADKRVLMTLYYFERMPIIQISPLLDLTPQDAS